VEHYVIGLLAGLGLAGVTYAAGPALVGPLRRLSDRLAPAS